MAKFLTVRQAADAVPDGAALVACGFGGILTAEGVLKALGERFAETGHPRELTTLHASVPGDGRSRGMNYLAQPGMIRRAMGGHFALMPKIAKLIADNQIEGYNFPQGVLSHMYRAAGAGHRFYLSPIGLKTYVDPRLEGGKMNAKTTEDLVELVTVDGREYLKYTIIQPTVAVLRGTTADELGNISMEKEANTLDALSMALAAHHNGGLVIVQVERLAQAGSLDPQKVKIPGVLVDIVAVADDPAIHMQSYSTQYDPALSGEIRRPIGAVTPLPLDVRKVIARRGVFELKPDCNINLGIGVPEGMGTVAGEEGMLHRCRFSVEAGIFGGMPLSGMDFGAAVNVEAIVDQCTMFDFYMGGGLDQTFLGLAQADSQGNVNVSRFGGKIKGCGGFIDITQCTPEVTFLGTMTADGLEVEIEDGKLRILREGKSKKFVRQVEQVTFSGDRAREEGQRVTFITERCVLRLEEDGLVLTEIAPGVDLEKDVLGQMEVKPRVSPDLKEMNPAIFREGKMGATFREV